MDMIIWYLTESGGDISYFNHVAIKGETISSLKLGQTFMNALSTDDYERLSTSSKDCFFTNDINKVLEAIDFLCTKDHTARSR